MFSMERILRFSFPFLGFYIKRGVYLCFGFAWEVILFSWAILAAAFVLFFLYLIYLWLCFHFK